MEPRYSIKEEKGAFFIYPPFGEEWVAACIDKEEAEKLCAEKNKKMQAEAHYTAVFRDENGKPRECKLLIETINLADVKAFEQPQEKQEKPKKKSIPRVLRPTVTLSEQDWASVHSILRIQGRTDIANAEAMLGHTDPYPAIDKIKRGLHDIRLAEYIKAQVESYCDAIRTPDDEDTPF